MARHELLPARLPAKRPLRWPQKDRVNIGGATGGDGDPSNAKSDVDACDPRSVPAKHSLRLLLAALSWPRRAVLGAEAGSPVLEEQSEPGGALLVLPSNKSLKSSACVFVFIRIQQK